MTDLAGAIPALYRRHAAVFDRNRGRNLFEKAWLDRFLADMAKPRRVLDLGCGMGEPIAAYLISMGCRITGVDTSPELLGLARTRFPAQEWIESDMRGLDLERHFDGILAFNSFFHLSEDDQRDMFPVFARHAAPGAALLFTSGPDAGEAIGSFEGEPLHHASLSPAEYAALLDRNRFLVRRFIADDPDCQGHSLWLAKRR